jgi:hypothetical protein
MCFNRWTLSAELRREQLKLYEVLPECLIISLYLLLLDSIKRHETSLANLCEQCVGSLCVKCADAALCLSGYRRRIWDSAQTWGWSGGGYGIALACQLAIWPWRTYVLWYPVSEFFSLPIMSCIFMLSHFVSGTRASGTSSNYCSSIHECVNKTVTYVLVN